MSMNITANVNVAISVIETMTLGLGAGNVSTPENYNQAFAAGTGAGNAQLYFSKPATAAAAPDTYVLSALTDSQGRAVAFTKVRLWAIVNLDPTDAHVLTVGNAATHPWAAPFGSGTHTLKVSASGAMIRVAPLLTAFAVASGSSDQLMVDPGAFTISYQILLIGE